VKWFLRDSCICLSWTSDRHQNYKYYHSGTTGLFKLVCDVHFVLMHVIVIVVPCRDVLYDFHIKMILDSSLLSFVLYVVHYLFMLFVLGHVHWCLTRFKFKIMFVSFDRSTIDEISSAGTVYLTR
jgi:hypothetical protein